VHRVVQQAILCDLVFGDVGERADDTQHFAVGADHRPRAQHEPQVSAAFGAEPEFLRDAPAPLLQHRVERHAETVAIAGVQDFQPPGGGRFERAARQTKVLLGFGAGVDEVAVDVPIPHDVARAGDRERAALDVVDDTFRADARESVLHDREANEHHDQLKAPE
jgi:hypothetical protein